MEVDPGQETEAFWQGLVLSRPHAAIFLVNPGGTIIKLNSAAQRILDSKQTFQVSNGRIWHCDPALQRHIQAAIGTTSPGKPDQVIMDAHRTLVRIVRIARPQHQAAHPCHSVLLVEASAETISIENWSTIFNLTPMELKVAKLLTCGNSGNEIANILNIKLTTVRAHIRALHNKCEVNSNIQLTHLLTKISFF